MDTDALRINCVNGHFKLSTHRPLYPDSIAPNLLLHSFSSPSHEAPSSSLLPLPIPHPIQLLSFSTPLLIHPAKSSVCAVESGIANKTQLVVFIVGWLPPQRSYSCQVRHVFPLRAKASPFQTH